MGGFSGLLFCLLSEMKQKYLLIYKQLSCVVPDAAGRAHLDPVMPQQQQQQMYRELILLSRLLQIKLPQHCFDQEILYRYL